jgi:hypothetical protein
VFKRIVETVPYNIMRWQRILPKPRIYSSEKKVILQEKKRGRDKLKINFGALLKEGKTSKK